MKTSSDIILVSRLYEAYDPFPPLFGDRPVSLEEVLGATMLTTDRPRLDISDRQFHLGRVKYLLGCFQSWKPLSKRYYLRMDPIVVDYGWDRLVPTGPILVDGHHRFCAAILGDVPKIRADFSGPVKDIRYFMGRRNTRPDFIL